MTRSPLTARLELLRLTLALALLLSNVSFLVNVEPALAAGASYYVSTSGSDTDAGSEAAPFKTIGKAAQVAAAGDVVYVKAGTYAERVTLSKSGTSGAPITVRTFGSDSVNVSSGFAITGSYNVVDGFEVAEGSVSPAVSISGSYNVANDLNIHHIGQVAHVERHGVTVGGNHNTLSNSYVGFCSGYSVSCSGTYNTLSNTTFEQGCCKPWVTGSFSGVGSQYGMQIGGSYNRVENCVSIRPWYGGMYSTGSHNYIWCEFRDNTNPPGWAGNGDANHRTCVMEPGGYTPQYNVYDRCNFGTGLSMQGCSIELDNDAAKLGNYMVTVTNSVLREGTYAAAILAQMEGNHSSTAWIRAYNNVFYGSAIYTDPDKEAYWGTGSWRLRNNIFATGNSDPLYVASGYTAMKDEDYNLFNSSSYGTKYGTNSIRGTVGFVSSTDLHLTSASAAIDKGVTDAYSPATDADGNTRTGTMDIGMYAYNSAGGDTTAPTVSITSPASGAAVSGSVALAATASDNVGVTRVEFYADGTLVGTDASSPYAATWNATSATPGSHTIQARAYDAAGNTSVSSVSVTVPVPPDTTAPTVSITSPASGATVSGSVALAATAADNVGVTKVEFYADGTLVGTDASSPYAGTWNATPATPGSHTIQARAYDAAGNTTNSSATVSVVTPPSDTTAPTVSITSPASGATVSGSVPLAAAASDNVGVARVEFYADGTLVGTDSTVPYTATWNATPAAPGSHTIQARAYDAAGNTTNSSVTVSVVTPPSDTTAPTVSITSPASGATVSGSVALAATASDNVGVTRVEFYADGNLVGADTSSPYAGTWNASLAVPGSHTIQARAYDAAGNTTTSSVTVTVPVPPDTTAPTVSITSPASGATVSGSVALAATASDNVGVTRVEFYADGTLVGTDPSSPYAATWDASAASPGSHTVQARAYDAAGNTTNSSIQLSVDSGTTPLAETNVALMAGGGEVVDYSDQFDSRALASYVIDGKAPFNTDYTGWWVKDPSASEYVTIEFASPSEVNRVKTVNDGQYGARAVTLSYSEDGTTFKQIGTFGGLDVIPGRPNPAVLDFAPVKARRMRFTYSQLNNSSWFQVSEIEAYGYPLAAKAVQSFKASSTYPKYASVKLDGRLLNGLGAPIPGKAMTIEYSSDKKAWKTLGTPITSSSNPGYFYYNAAPTRATYYRVHYRGDSAHVPSAASIIFTRPQVYLSTPVATSTMRYGRAYFFYGYLKPRHTSGTKPIKLLAYRYQGGKWVYRKYFYAQAYNVSGYTKYKASVKLPYKGRWRIRAYHASDSANYTTYSGYRYVTVK